MSWIVFDLVAILAVGFVVILAVIVAVLVGVLVAARRRGREADAPEECR